MFKMKLKNLFYLDSDLILFKIKTLKIFYITALKVY